MDKRKRPKSEDVRDVDQVVDWSNVEPGSTKLTSSRYPEGDRYPVRVMRIQWSSHSYQQGCSYRWGLWTRTQRRSVAAFGLDNRSVKTHSVCRFNSSMWPRSSTPIRGEFFKQEVKTRILPDILEYSDSTKMHRNHRNDVGEARADAFGPELVARSDDAWRMRSNAMPSIYNMRVSTVKARDRPGGLGKAQHSNLNVQGSR